MTGKAFASDPALEQLVKLPADYSRLPSARKMAVGYYLAARDAADNEPPPAA